MNAVATRDPELDTPFEPGDDIDPADPYMGTFPDFAADAEATYDTSKYKYGEFYSSEWRWRNEYGHPRITDHAAEKWDERTPPSAVSPEWAWLHSKRVKYLTECDDLTDRDGTTPDGVRLYYGRTLDGKGYTVVFLVQARQIPCIRTVYPIEFFTESPVKSFLSAVADQYPYRNGEESGGGA